MVMKEVSSKLDDFIKKLQETEIPKEAEAIQELLSAQVFCDLLVMKSDHSINRLVRAMNRTKK